MAHAVRTGRHSSSAWAAGPCRAGPSDRQPAHHTLRAAMATHPRVAAAGATAVVESVAIAILGASFGRSLLSVCASAAGECDRESGRPLVRGDRDLCAGPLWCALVGSPEANQPSSNAPVALLQLITHPQPCQFACLCAPGRLPSPLRSPPSPPAAPCPAAGPPSRLGPSRPSPPLPGAHSLRRRRRQRRHSLTVPPLLVSPRSCFQRSHPTPATRLPCPAAAPAPLPRAS